MSSVVLQIVIETNVPQMWGVDRASRLVSFHRFTTLRVVRCKKFIQPDHYLLEQIQHSFQVIPNNKKFYDYLILFFSI